MDPEVGRVLLALLERAPLAEVEEPHKLPWRHFVGVELAVELLVLIGQPRRVALREEVVDHVHVDSDEEGRPAQRDA